jgi:hypothetical protein
VPFVLAGVAAVALLGGGAALGGWSYLRDRAVVVASPSATVSVAVVSSSAPLVLVAPTNATATATAPTATAPTTTAPTARPQGSQPTPAPSVAPAPSGTPSAPPAPSRPVSLSGGQFNKVCTWEQAKTAAGPVLGRVNACWDAARADPATRTSQRYNVTVGDGGRVTGVSPYPEGTRSAALDRCMDGALRAMTVPAPVQPGAITMRFER